MANMVNNIGTTSTVLPIIIGEIKEFATSESIATIAISSGELGLGFLLFDSDGTMSVCTKITADEEGNPSYTFTTSSISADAVIKNALSESY